MPVLLFSAESGHLVSESSYWLQEDTGSNQNHNTSLSGFQGNRNLARQLVSTYPSRSQNSHFLNGTEVQGQTALSWWKMDTCLVSEAPACSISAFAPSEAFLRQLEEKKNATLNRQGQGCRARTRRQAVHLPKFYSLLNFWGVGETVGVSPVEEDRKASSTNIYNWLTANQFCRNQTQVKHYAA